MDRGRVAPFDLPVSPFGIRPSDFGLLSDFGLRISDLAAALSPRLSQPLHPNNDAVRICVIFNPAARGDKARRFRRHLDEIASQCALKSTSGPGDARKLAAEAVDERFEIVVAAGGDGTVNEVLNGIGDAASGFERT